MRKLSGKFHFFLRFCTRKRSKTYHYHSCVWCRSNKNSLLSSCTLKLRFECIRKSSWKKPNTTITWQVITTIILMKSSWKKTNTTITWQVITTTIKRLSSCEATKQLDYCQETEHRRMIHVQRSSTNNTPCQTFSQYTTFFRFQFTYKVVEKRNGFFSPSSWIFTLCCEFQTQWKFYVEVKMTNWNFVIPRC